MKRLLALCSGVCLAVASFSRADDWPQFRGPDRTNVSRETGLLKSWPKDGPKLRWTFRNAGLGYSGPAIVGGKLYVLGTKGAHEVLIVLDAKTGQELRTVEIGPIFEEPGQYGNGPRSTPTVVGGRVYALGGQGDLACIDPAEGKKLWQHNLFKDFDGAVMDNYGTARIGWGYAEGPLVDGDLVVVTPGGEKGTLLALDKNSGKVVWRSQDVKEKAPYSSVQVAEIGGIKQYIQMTEKGPVGVNAKDGSLVWRYAKEYSDIIIPTPLIHDGHVYATAGFGQGCDLIQLSAAAKGMTATKVYANKVMTNEEGGVVLVDGHVYGYSDTGGKGWVCQDFKTGKLAWLERRKLGKGSLTVADGMLYSYTQEEGTAALAEASPAKPGWKETGRFTIPEQSKLRAKFSKAQVWTHPVVADGCLFLRDQELIFCYDVKGKE